MSTRLMLPCPDCRVNRRFRDVDEFTMPDGKKGLVRTCTKCGFKRHFTPDGRAFNHRERRRSAIAGTGLNAFLNQTSNLSTHDKGLKFEQYCQTLLEAMGYEVEHTGQSGDRGVDLKAALQQPIGRQTLVVQCKHQESVSAEVVIQILGMVNATNVNQGLVITTGSFTADAKQFAEENPTIEIIDGLKLAELVRQYID